MTVEAARTQCVICGKGKAMYKCEGCQQSFCFNHLTDHNQELTQRLEQVENERNLFKQSLNQYQQDLSKHPLIEQINQWERNSIHLIQQTAEDARKSLFQYTSEQIPNIETQLNKLTDQMKELRNENDFNEIHLDHLKIGLDKLQKQLKQPGGIRITESSTLIKKVNLVVFSSKQPNVGADAKRNSNAITVAGTNGSKSQPNQLSGPKTFIFRWGKQPLRS